MSQSVRSTEATLTRYRTIVADPPWPYESSMAGTIGGAARRSEQRSAPMPYGTMTIAAIADLPVANLAERDAHLYLWTTQRFLRDAFDILDAWGFRSSAVLVWSKPPKGVVGTFVASAEFVLFARRGTCGAKSRHIGTVFNWPRSQHSAKPEAFLDLVEQISPGPYAELFSRRARFGWDYPIGDQALGGRAA